MEQDKINELADKIIASANELKDCNSEIFSEDKLSSLLERENKWHEISRNQLSFFNNLLILLATGFIAFVVKDCAILSISSIFIFLSIISMTVSCFFGLSCGFNRMVDFRYTHKTNTFRRKLYEKNHSEYGEGDYEGKIKWSIYYWVADADFFTVEDKNFVEAPESVKLKINACVKLKKQLGKFTRNLLRFQIVFFLISIVLFAVSYT